MGHFTRYLLTAVFVLAMKALFSLPIGVAAGLFILFGGGPHLMLHWLEGSKKDRPNS